MVVKDEDVFSQLDLGYLGQFLAQRINELVLSDCRRTGFPSMRVSHGYIVQHLVTSSGPVSRTGSELARRMGVTQQAASKAVAELVRLGVVEIEEAPDRRAKNIRLTTRGWEGVQYSRRSRSRLEAKIGRQLGMKRYLETKKALRDCITMIGGVGRIQSRRVRQPG
jgi:DNA-binding MarR family transcriptional regulator